MYLIEANNINDAYHTGMHFVDKECVERESRNGLVLEAITPVTTVYKRPWERVLFCDARNPNPFFHFMEGIWMLSGSQNINWIARYNKRMKLFSPDGNTADGSYGYRWRDHFGFDQLKAAIELLKANEDDRRVVIAHWDANYDFENYIEDFRNGNSPHPDLPCNTSIYLYIRNNKLTMTVCNRSNDMIWGAYGANAVHMSMLQEFLAASIGVEIGEYYQISNSFHVYKNIWDELKQKYFSLIPRLFPMFHNPYATGEVEHTTLVSYPENFLRECELFVESDFPIKYDYVNRVFTDVAIPMTLAWDFHKQRNYGVALEMCDKITHSDWRKACRVWVEIKRSEWSRSSGSTTSLLGEA